MSIICTGEGVGGGGMVPVLQEVRIKRDKRTEMRMKFWNSLCFFIFTLRINLIKPLPTYYYNKTSKSPSFLKKYFKTKKPFSLIAKGLEIVKLP